jgi:fumarylacetoacetate (FAA) hydrolase family protein
MRELLTPSHVLPFDHRRAVLIGRVWVPGQGPTLVQVRDDALIDLSDLAPTCSDLLELDYPAGSVRKFAGPKLADTAAALANSAWCNALPDQPQAAQHDRTAPSMLAPVDLQAIKAAGVTFADSLLERVIEEQAGGDPARAESVRATVQAALGDQLGSVRPGSPQALELRHKLTELGLWSQYLEVGIGPEAEVFTKAQPLSAVGVGAQVGVHPASQWNNPEPEVVLVVNSRGLVKGATLGNDVNLRDVEGRSALLLGRAKDNNASCALGPFIRLFDPDFSINDVRSMDLTLHVSGTDGFELQGKSTMRRISRDPLDLVFQTFGDHHQYPDGFALFMGTLFAPTQDRGGPGQGFTHAMGDVVQIGTPQLGTLVNSVNATDAIAPWTYGARALMRDLGRRGLIR